MTNGPPNPAETAAVRKAGIAQISLSVVQTIGGADESKMHPEVKALLETSAKILQEVVKQWPWGESHADIVASPK